MSLRTFRFGRSAALVIVLSLACTAGSFIFIQSQHDDQNQHGHDFQRGFDSLSPEVLSAFDAVRDGQCDELEQMLKKNPMLVNADTTGFSLMDLAAARGNTQVADLLLKYHADPDAPDRMGQTPLDYAAFAGSKDMVDWLIMRRANVNSRSRMDFTPIYYAARGSSRISDPRTDYVGVCDDLLKAGASVETPRNWAMLVASEPVARFLFDHGAKLQPFDLPQQNDAPSDAGQGRDHS